MASHSYARWMNRMAVAVFVLALLAFVAFHFLVEEYYVELTATGESEVRGWETWGAIWDYRESPDFGQMPEILIIPSFLCFAALALASPFLVPVFRKSRPLWWIGVLLSGMILLTLGGLMVTTPVDPGFSLPGPGTYCLMGALVLNFLGFLFVRRVPLSTGHEV